MIGGAIRPPHASFDAKITRRFNISTYENKFLNREGKLVKLSLRRERSKIVSDLVTRKNKYMTLKDHHEIQMCLY